MSTSCQILPSLIQDQIGTCIIANFVYKHIYRATNVRSHGFLINLKVLLIDHWPNNVMVISFYKTCSKA